MAKHLSNKMQFKKCSHVSRFNTTCLQLVTPMPKRTADNNSHCFLRVGCTARHCLKEHLRSEHLTAVSLEFASTTYQDQNGSTLCIAYETYYKGESPIPTQYFKRALELILQENSFQFIGKTTFKHMEQPWVLKWQSLLPTSLWERKNHKS